MSQQYAAIGTDGTRPVVWGLGESPEEAREDAMGQLREQLEDPDCESNYWLTLPITTEQATLIEGGEVSTEALGVELPAAWLKEHQGK